MQVEDVLSSLKPELIEEFRLAIEIGKWSDGTKLSKEQLETCMQAVIVYEKKNLPEDQRVGFMPKKPGACGSSNEDADVQKLDLK